MFSISLITADFAGATVVISACAVIGKVSRLQLLIFGIVEVVFFAINETLLVHYLKVTDAGGTMVIHLFAAYFAVAVCRVVARDDTCKGISKEGSSYNSDIFCMIGKY